MLQAIRSRAGSLIVKILFAVLIISFGIWGIADVFRQRTPAETTVADVGGIKIKADALQVAVNREMENMRRLFGSNFNADQAKQLGIVDGVLNRMVASDLLSLEEQRLGIGVADQVVYNAIFANPNFHNSSGAFDPNLFKLILANNQLSEASYFNSVRQDIERSVLTGAVAGGAVAPPELVDPLFRRQNEKRVADTVFIANAAMTGIPEPSEADLQAFYDKHQEAFRAPEYRGFTVAELRPEDLAASMDVPEEKLRKEYDSRQDEFQTPERREIEQMLLPDEAKAKEAEAQLAAGKDFAAVAKEVAGQDADAIKFGWVERKDMPQALADVAFALAKDGTSKPVQDALGWHILRVTGIQQGGTKSFDEVKDQLKTEVARDMAADEVFKEHNEIEDALAGGATIEQVAEKFKMKTTKVPAVDLDGRDPKGEHAAVSDAEILHTAFNTDQGQTSRLTETKDNGYFLLRVDSVTPSAEKPLAEVKDKVKEMWLADKRNAAAEAEAKAIGAAVGPGKSLAEIAGGKKALPATLVARIFALKQGEAGVSEGADGWYVAQVKSIEEPDPKADKAGVDQLSERLAQGMESDLLAEFDKALRARYPVEINRKDIDRLL